MFASVSRRWGERWLYPSTLQLTELHILLPITHSWYNVMPVQTVKLATTTTIARIYSPVSKKLILCRRSRHYGELQSPIDCSEHKIMTTCPKEQNVHKRTKQCGHKTTYRKSSLSPTRISPPPPISPLPRGKLKR